VKPEHRSDSGLEWVAFLKTLMRLQKNSSHEFRKGDAARLVGEGSMQ
jgi:hypothetical protein